MGHFLGGPLGFGDIKGNLWGLSPGMRLWQRREQGLKQRAHGPLKTEFLLAAAPTWKSLPVALPVCKDKTFITLPTAEGTTPLLQPISTHDPGIRATAAPILQLCLDREPSQQSYPTVPSQQYLTTWALALPQNRARGKSRLARDDTNWTVQNLRMNSEGCFCQSNL